MFVLSLVIAPSQPKKTLVTTHSTTAATKAPDQNATVVARLGILLVAVPKPLEVMNEAALAADFRQGLVAKLGESRS